MDGYIGYILFNKHLLISPPFPENIPLAQELRLRERAGEALRAAAARRAEVGGWRWTENDGYIYIYIHTLYIYVLFFFGNTRRSV